MRTLALIIIFTFMVSCKPERTPSGAYVPAGGYSSNIVNANKGGLQDSIYRIRKISGEHIRTLRFWPNGQVATTHPSNYNNFDGHKAGYYRLEGKNIKISIIELIFDRDPAKWDVVEYTISPISDSRLSIVTWNADRREKIVGVAELDIEATKELKHTIPDW